MPHYLAQCPSLHPLAHLRHDINPHEHDPSSETPPYCNMPEIYTYLVEDPPEDSRYQCYCAHLLCLPESDGDETDPDHIQDPYFTVRCTRSFTQADYAAGCTLCALCRPPPDLIEDWAYQVRLAAEHIIYTESIILNPRMHWGYYAALVQERLRRRKIFCQCYCSTCATPGNSNQGRLERDFTCEAQEIARDDVDAFVNGNLPIPSRRFYTLEQGLLRRR